MDVLVRSLGRAMGLSGTSLTQLSTAARFRDLGMRAVPDEIITKTEPLTDEEWAIVRSHPERSAEMLGPSPLFAEVRAIVRSTHEHVDGSGYPDGMSGDDIPLAARIILVAESHLALEAMGDADPLSTLRERAGTVYDAGVVEALAAVLGESSASRAAHG
jgi:HD-GYP domain-containing protein (c-di-GMP phosphodiesterase class II)